MENYLEYINSDPRFLYRIVTKKPENKPEKPNNVAAGYIPELFQKAFNKIFENKNNEKVNVTNNEIVAVNNGNSRSNDLGRVYTLNRDTVITIPANRYNIRIARKSGTNVL